MIDTNHNHIIAYFLGALQEINRTSLYIYKEKLVIDCIEIYEKI